MGSRKSRGTQDWPMGLYGRTKGAATYYSFRDPTSGKEIAIGKDLKAAISAIRVIQRRQASDPVQSIISKIERPECTVRQHYSWFMETYLPSRRRKNGERLANGTLDNYRLTLGRAADLWGDRSITSPVRAEVVALIESWPAETGNRARAHLVTFFAHAQARGLREDNPAEGTVKRDVVAQRARLEPSHYQLILAAAPPWLQRAMQLELLSLQRPGDLCRARREHWDGIHWRVRQSKGRGHGYGLLRIKPHPALQAAIEDCLAHQAEDCPYLLSWVPARRRPSKDRDHACQLSEQILSRAFSEVRDQVCLDLPAVPPSFYEIKGLGARLYEEAGRPLDWIQALAGHQDQATTRIYTDRHQEKWVEVIC